MIRRIATMTGFAAGMMVWSDGALGQVIADGAQGQHLERSISANDPPLVSTSRPPQLGVMDRPHPEYDSQGVRAGGFIVNAALISEIGYSDNVYARRTDTREDLIGVVSPVVKFRSNWERHHVEGDARVDVRRYMDNEQENVETGTAGLANRIDIDGETFVTASVRNHRLFDLRGEPESINSDTPTKLSINTATAGVFHGTGPLSLSAVVRMREFEYDDGRSVAGQRIDNRGRNNTSSDLVLRAGYEFSPIWNTYVRASLMTRDNDRYRSTPSASRDSQGYSVVVGTIFDFSELWSGEVFVGPSHRKFEYGGFDSIDTITYGGNLLWNVTRLTSIRTAAMRTLEPSLVSGSPAYDVTQFWAGIEHELTDNIVLHANIGKRWIDYRQTDLNMGIVSTGVGAIWLINSNLRASAEYNHTSRAVSTPIQDFDRNVGLVRLSAQF